MPDREGWSIIETRFDPATSKAYEGLFTLGSGYLHVRGSLEEHLSGAPQNVDYTRLPANVTSEQFRDPKSKWGTYVPGIFGRHPLLNNEMINLPWFLELVPVIDGERLDVEHCTIEEYRRELRLDTATLVRTLRWRTQSGRQVALSFERFVSAVRPFLCMQRLRISADRQVDVAVHFGIDPDVRTNGHDHFQRIEPWPRPMGCECSLVTDQGDKVAIISSLDHRFQPSSELQLAFDCRWPGEERVTQAFGHLPANEELTLEKRTVVATSRDRVQTTTKQRLTEIDNQDFASLHAEHAEAWRQRWETCDVIIEGDPDAQLAMRTALYHLLRAHAPDSRVAIDAKGYAGEAYWGRYFWDTEMYLLPFYLYTAPEKARTLADFRVQSLPGARANAARYGYPGARYAWESDAGGFECCPNWQYADHEIHVTADVVFGLAHYAHATGRSDYLTGPAAQVILETARYWLARVDRRPGDEHVSLLGVMGPDEYTPISNNNSYTNRMAAFALDLAAQVGEALDLPPAEWEPFARTAELLPIVYDTSNELVLQCEGFDRLADARFDELWKDRTKTFAAQVSQERLYRSQCLKQADVLMLMMLFPDQFSPAEVRRAWDYYLPLTTHDSSLSAGTHAIVACRLGLDDEAWRFWQMGRGLDLDVAHGGAAEGIHIANAGAVWQMAVFGFAGLRTAMQAEHLTLAPRLPQAWSRLAFPLIWKGVLVYVDIRPGNVRVDNRGGEPLTVDVHGETRPIAPGASATFTG